MKPRLIVGVVLGLVALLWLLWPKPGLPEAQATPPDPPALATQPGESLARSRGV